MEQSSRSLQPPPRLRLNRQSRAGSSTGHSAAFLEGSNLVSDDEDDGSTPRRPMLDLSRREDTPVPGSDTIANSDDNPAVRLRALLVRVSSQSQEMSTSPHTTSEHESDFEPPESEKAGLSTSNGPAVSDLKAIFSRALRDPRDSPLRTSALGRPRRNSIGTSDAHDSPVRPRAKRKSLSDDEKEKSSHTPRDSMRSSAAALFDNLRQQLENKSLELRSMAGSSMDISRLPGMSDSQDMSYESGPQSPPPATSTPLRQSESHFPSQFSASNLMREDSSLQRFMRAVEHDPPSDYIAPPPPLFQRKAKYFPTPGPSRTPRALPISHETQSMDVDMDLASSRTQQAMNSPLNGFHDEEITSHTPISTPPSRRFDPLSKRSPTQVTTAQPSQLESSSMSLVSSTEFPSRSAASLLATAATGAILKGKQKATPPKAPLNRAHSSGETSFTASTSGGRTRTLSHPSRPTAHHRNSLPPATRGRPSSALSHIRIGSFVKNHIHSPSRSHSPASSISSQNSSIQEVEHERERNWNSSHPKWEHDPELRETQRASTPLDDILHERTKSTIRVRPRTHSSIPHFNRQELEHSTQEVESSSSKLEHRVRTISDVGTTANANGTITSKSPGIRNRFGWSFPQPTSSSEAPSDKDDIHVESPISHGHTRNPSTPSTGLNSRLHYKHSVSSHIPVRSGGSSSIPIPPSPHSPRTKGHKRTTTELHQGIGAIPPSRTSVAAAAISLRESDTESLADTDLDESALSQAGVQDTTPHTPLRTNGAANGLEHPSSPDNQDPRFQFGHTPSPFTKPVASSTPPTTQFNSMVEDSRKFTMFTKKAIPDIPPTPPGLPDLPDLPTPTSDDDTDRTPPVRRTLFETPTTSLANMKTPRPPGAWATPFTTPMPSLQRHFSAENADDNMSALSAQTPTPPDSLSRAYSLPPQTPAPPGAWAATPVSSIGKRRGLKVRFDESVSPILDGTGDETTQQQYQSPTAQIAPPPPPSVSSTPPQVATDPLPQEPLPSPPRPSPRRRRSSGIRVLDAFGREIPHPETAVEPTEQNESTQNESKLPATNALTTSQISRSRVHRYRIVDATGNEIAEEPRVEQEQPVEYEITRISDEERKEGKKVKAVLQKTIADLKQDLEKLDMSFEAGSPVDANIPAIKQRSLRASSEREKIARQLRNLDLSKFYSPTVEVPEEKRSWWRFRRTWAMLLLQIIVGFIMWRYSQHAARRLFLTAYYDPFYPELYLQFPVPELTSLPSGAPYLNVPRRLLTVGDETSAWQYFLAFFRILITDFLSFFTHLLWNNNDELPTDTPTLVSSWPPT